MKKIYLLILVSFFLTGCFHEDKNEALLEKCSDKLFMERNYDWENAAGLYDTAKNKLQENYEYRNIWEQCERDLEDYPIKFKTMYQN